MEMEIRFPGGVVVEAHFAGHAVRTDQPQSDGGTDAAPSPFDLFLASIGTCIGFYAVQFCRARRIDTEGMSIRVASERDAETKMVRRMQLDIEPPAGLPERYRAALLRAADHCTVKRHLADPPEIELRLAPAARVS